MVVSMFALILISFVFALLVFLLIKSPKAGAIFAGVLVCLVLAGVFGVRFLAAGAGGGIGVMPLFVIVVPLVFILLIGLLTKAPKVGIGVLVALVTMVVAGVFVAVPVSHRRAVPIQETRMEPTAVLPRSVEPVGASPIWSEGMDVEFDADIYPSQTAAVRALGGRIREPLKQAIADVNAPAEIVILQEGIQQSLVSAFQRAIQDSLPDVPCSIEAGLRNIRSGDGEVGLTLRREVTTREMPQGQGTGLTILRPVEAGRLVAKVFGIDRRASVEANYIEKSWVEDFASFANERADRQFFIARSRSACTNEYQARREAVQDACRQVAQIIREQGRSPRGGSWSVNPSDIEEAGLVIDQFVQSFDGSTGDIWRQALLLDVSTAPLRRLETRISSVARVSRMTWARMIGSAVGVVALIAVIYFFLNMATRGYYEWSLRIAGVVLAIVAVISVLMMVQ